MCSSFRLYRRDGTTIGGSTCAELAAAIAPAVIRGYDGTPYPPGDYCLCPLDMPMTARAAGMALRAPSWYPGEEWDAWVLRDIANG